MTTKHSFSVEGKRVVVVGAARSGVAAAELLVRRGAAVTLTDMRDTIAEDAQLRDAGVQLELGGHRPRPLLGADLIVLSPGVPPAQPAIAEARAAGVPVIGELELASRWLRGRVVAITGTKGKSTTTTLTGRMLEAGGHRVLVGGNIGLALSAQVDESTENTIHVVETSSFPARGVRHVPSVDRRAPQLSRRTTSTGTPTSRSTRRPRPASSQPDRGDWAVLNADDEASQVIAQDARSQRCCSRSIGSCPREWPSRATRSSAAPAAASRSWCRCRP
jgi:UDP-N-acetylmuramoylalanine--D-glutamate ligase